MNHNPRGLYTDTRLQSRCHLCSHLVVRLSIVGILLDFNGIFIGEVLLKDTDKILARYDEHIVLSAQNVDSSVRSAAGALAVVDPADVACAETNQRTRVLAESCKYKLAYLTGLEDFARMDIDGFN